MTARRRELSEDEGASFDAAYLVEGCTLAGLGQRFNMARSTALRLRKERGLPSMPPGPRPGRGEVPEWRAIGWRWRCWRCLQLVVGDICAWGCEQAKQWRESS